MIFSCSNDEEIGTIKSDPIISQLQNSLHLDKFTDQNISENLEVNWNDVNKTTANGIEIYEIEISEKEMTKIKSGQFQEKLKYELIGIKQNDSMHTYLVEAFSNLNDRLYSQSIKDLQYYSGFLNVYDFNGNNLGQISIKEGRALSTSKNQVLTELINTINLFSKPSLKSLTNRIANCVYTVPIYHEIFLEKYKIVQTVDGKILDITFLGSKKIDSYTTYLIVSYPCESGADEIHIPYRRKEYQIINVSSQTDPCSTGVILSNISQNAVYLSALNNVKSADSTKEHSITLGKDANGNITQAPMNNGGPVKVETNTSWAGAFGAIHNHPNNTPISGGDIYAAVTLNSGNSNFTTTFVYTDGEMYAAVVTDLAAAKAFVAAYPADIRTGYNPEFPDFILDQIDYIQAYNTGSTITGRTDALAFILNKYNAGITLLNQDSSGRFNPIQIKETTNTNGSKTYTSTPCN